METIQNKPLNRCEEVLAHEGVKGMHWYIRRYQPYPSGYDGEGKFVGKRAARKAAKIEKRQARHQAKVKKKIDNAVDTGNKKSLNKLRDEMSSEEYDAKYKELVNKGIDNAVKDRDTGSLKKFKEDMTPREYKHQKDRIEFKEAIDDDNSRKTKKLLSKVDPEDVAEATNLIKSRVALQDQKLSKIRQDSELMAKMDKLSSGLGKISKISQNVSSITNSFMSVNKSMTEFANAQKDAEKKRKEKELEKIIRSGNIEKIQARAKDMTENQLNEAYNRIIQSGSKDDIRAAAPYMNNKQITAAVQKLDQMNKLNEKLGSSSSSTADTTTTSEASRSAPVQAVRDWIDSGFSASSDRTSSSDRHRFLINQSSAATTVGEARSIVGSQMSSNILNQDLWWNSRRDGSYTIAHSDDISYEDVLAHHGVLGMKWGIRRYQNKDGSLTKEGRERLKIDKYDKRNRDFVIPKGTKANRWVSTSRIQDYEVLKGPQGVNEYLKRIEDAEKQLETKYVSIDDIKRDGKPNGYDYYMSWFTNEFYEPKNAYVNEYIVKKDVKVAAASKVIDALIEDVGEVKMKELLENGRSINVLAMKYTQNRELRDRVNEKFKNMGYDAVEDINDNETNMPIIFLNSSKQLGAPINKTSGEKAIEDYYKRFK